MRVSGASWAQGVRGTWPEASSGLPGAQSLGTHGAPHPGTQLHHPLDGRLNSILVAQDDKGGPGPRGWQRDQLLSPSRAGTREAGPGPNQEISLWRSMSQIEACPSTQRAGREDTKITRQELRDICQGLRHTGTQPTATPLGLCRLEPVFSCFGAPTP